MKVECAYSELIKTAEIKSHPRNPNTHPESQIELLAKIIEETGWRSPLVVSKRSGFVVKGHGRLAAAVHAGFEFVPVDLQDYESEEQGLSDLVADNRIAELAEMDGELLDGILMDLHVGEVDMDLTGFGDWLPDVEEVVGLTGPDDVPDQAPLICRLGQVWRLGKHRLMCGDSTSLNNVQVLMGGGVADMLLTDPPYNVDYTGGTKAALKIENDNLPDAEFLQFLTDAFASAVAALRPGGAFYIWHADSEGYNFRGACRAVDLQVRQCIIWNKNSLVLGRQDYQWKHEPCLYGWKDGAAHRWFGHRNKVTVQDIDDPALHIEEDGALCVALGEMVYRITATDIRIEQEPSTIIHEAKPAVSRLHPTMKPVALYERQINNSSKLGDSVLDLFGGSGTTVIACEKLHRRAFVMEFDPRYCDVIIKRWEDFTGGKAELIDA